MFVSEAVGSWGIIPVIFRLHQVAGPYVGGLRRRATAANRPERQIMNTAHVVMKLSLFHSLRDSGKIDLINDRQYEIG